MTVEEYPTERMLCLHNSGYHAMHPVYDACGKEGRQYVLNANRSWIGDNQAKTVSMGSYVMCTNLIQTKGYLYGIDYDGDHS